MQMKTTAARIVLFLLLSFFVPQRCFSFCPRCQQEGAPGSRSWQRFSSTNDLVGRVYRAADDADLPQEHLKGSTIIIFEATEQYGVGALTLGRPITPLRIGQLGSSKRLAVFKDNPLYAGGAFGDSTTVPTEMSPWYWLHPYHDVPKSTKLSDSAYLGGNCDVLSEKAADCPATVHFFWRHTEFLPGELETQLEKKQWIQLSDDAWKDCC
jgi:putative AlgH/UPF0301 family transcriptional regulator